MVLDINDVWQQGGSEFTAMRLDYTGRSDGQPLYIGWAMPGTIDGTTGWKICKLEYTAEGFMYKRTWASGNSNMDKEWDERASYTYS